MKLKKIRKYWKIQNPSNNPVKLKFLEKHLENIIDLINKYDLVDLINAISKVT